MEKTFCFYRKDIDFNSNTGHRRNVGEPDSPGKRGPCWRGLGMVGGNRSVP